jgi:hypothetical protein
LYFIGGDGKLQELRQDGAGQAWTLGTLKDTLAVVIDNTTISAHVSFSNGGVDQQLKVYFFPKIIKGQARHGLHVAYINTNKTINTDGKWKFRSIAA